MTTKSDKERYLALAPTIPGGVQLFDAVLKKQASKEVQQHALFTYYCQQHSQRSIARLYGKSLGTINTWTKRWEINLEAGRRVADPTLKKKFGEEQRKWITDYYDKYPLTFIDEGCAAFQHHWKKTISPSQLWRILNDAGYTWKEVERRAKFIRNWDIARFAADLMSINWTPRILCFLDEVSFDLRDMIRTRGYSPRGQRIIAKEEAVRSKRISLLCFVNIRGLQDAIITPGTFTRQTFFKCCRSFALSGKVSIHPGVNSVWIMDGARIHCDKNIVNYLRSLGIIVILLPAYCPFYNPIEPFFGVVKSRMRRFYREHTMSLSLLPVFVGFVLYTLRDFDMRGLFEKAGYGVANAFNPLHAYTPEVDFHSRRVDAEAADDVEPDLSTADLSASPSSS